MAYNPNNILFSNRPSLKPSIGNKPMQNAKQIPMSPLGRPSPLGTPQPFNTSNLPNFNPAIDTSLEDAAALEALLNTEFTPEISQVRPRASGLQIAAPGQELSDYIPGVSDLSDPEQFPDMVQAQGVGFGQEFYPASHGTVSNPGGQGKEAHDNYRRNMGWVDDLGIANENMGIAKAEAFEKAYKSGNVNPGSTGGQGYARAIADKNGNMIGFIDKQGNQHAFEKPMGRMGQQSLEERTSNANRGITGDLLNRLGGLAKKHESHIGPYASKYVGLQRSGLIPGMEGPDPEVAEMYTIAADLQNKQVYEQSGKQINEAEFERLKQTMPRLDQDSTSFWAAYNNFLSQLKQRGITLAGQDPTSLQQEVNPQITPQIQGQNETSRGTSYKIIG